MSERQLKPGWRWVRFGEVVNLNKDRVADPQEASIERYVGLEHLEPGDLHIRSWGLVEEGTTFTNHFKRGQVLFGKRRAYQRKVAVADFEGVCSGDIYVFESNDPNVLLPGLLPFICQTDAFFDYAVGTSAGSLSPRTNWKSLAKYEFALPPLEEQEDLIAVFEGLNNLVIDLDILLKAAKRTRMSLAIDTFARDLEGASMELGSIITESMYGPRFSGSLYKSDGAVAQLRTTDIDEDGSINYQGIPRADLDPSVLRDHILQSGDVVISRSGTCGITAVYQESQIPTIAAAFLIRLRTSEAMHPYYLHEYFSSPLGRQHTESLSRGGVQKNISGSNLLAQQVPCPPYERQLEVVRTLKTVRECERSIACRLIALRLQKARCLKEWLAT